jgi:hypothetical protein
LIFHNISNELFYIKGLYKEARIRKLAVAEVVSEINIPSLKWSILEEENAQEAQSYVFTRKFKYR